MQLNSGTKASFCICFYIQWIFKYKLLLYPIPIVLIIFQTTIKSHSLWFIKALIISNISIFQGCLLASLIFFLSFFSFFINPHPRTCLLIFGERVREGEGEKPMWDRIIDWLPLVHAPTREWTHNLGMCPHWESNPQSFSSQDDVPTI